MSSNIAYARVYGFDSALEKALFDSDIEPEIYEKVIEFAHSILPEVHKYYAVKKKTLGIEEYMLCDEMACQ